MKTIVGSLVLVVLTHVTWSRSLEGDPGQEAEQGWADDFKNGGTGWEFFNDTFVGDYMELKVTTQEEVKQGRFYKGKDGSAREFIVPYDQTAGLEAGEVVWGPYFYRNEAEELIESGWFFTVLNSDNKIVVDVMWRDYFYRE